MTIAIQNLLKDEFPDIKIKISDIFGYIDEDSFLDGKSFIDHIIKVTRHKRWKVRLAGTKALYDLILRKECQCLCDNLIGEYKRLSQDKNQVFLFSLFNFQKIRAEVYKTIENALNKFTWEFVKKFEVEMILILMNSLEDDQESIRENGKIQLEKVAANRKLLYEKYEN